MTADPQPDIHSAILGIVRGLGLTYPIGSKQQFIQAVHGRSPVVFDGVEYDPAASAERVPDYYFPVADEADMLAKVKELMSWRGMIAIEEGG